MLNGTREIVQAKTVTIAHIGHIPYNHHMTTRERLAVMLPLEERRIADIAGELGVSEGRIYQLLSALGARLVVTRTWIAPEQKP